MAGPLSTLARDHWVAQARDGISRLEQDPRDPVGRGLLGEAWARLEGDRPGWVDEAHRRLLVPVAPQLPIRTERLLLRRVVPSDAADLHSYYGRADVAAYLVTPPLSRAEAEVEVHRRIRLNDDVGPDGPRAPDALGLVLELEGRVVGDVVLIYKGPDYSQAEVGWVIHPDAGGRGLVTEAVRALLDIAFVHHGFHRVYAELDARNTRSAAMCERLGMRREAHGLKDFWSKGEWTDSFRYAVLGTDFFSRPPGL